MSELAKLFDADEPFSSSATEQDIYSCFRLLLNRYPDGAEWSQHSRFAGQNLRSVVRAFLDSQEFAEHQRVARDPVRQMALTQAAGFVIYTAADDLAVGQHVAAGAYEPAVESILRRIVRPGMNFVDIGANIGFFTMLAASLVGAKGLVLAIEPNLANVRMIEASRRENRFDQVVIAACAVGASSGLLMLSTAFSNGMTGPIGEALAEIMTLPIVPCFPLQALLQERRIDAIKIDVEGAEHVALSTSRDLLARWRPIIVSEFSPELLQRNSGISGMEYLEFFGGLGYHAAVLDGVDRAPAQSFSHVMEAYAHSGGDHIDIILMPDADFGRAS